MEVSGPHRIPQIFQRPHTLMVQQSICFNGKRKKPIYGMEYILCIISFTTVKANHKITFKLARFIHKRVGNELRERERETEREVL